LHRTICYIDGFNLYHAIDALNERDPARKNNHLKWLDLWRLASIYVHPQHQILEAVYYFSAFAKWIPSSYRRHKAYVRALEAMGISVELSKFYEKDRRCGARCRQWYKAHEEKQSDVKIAIWMLNHAGLDMYDRAVLIGADSDIAPAVRVIRERFPEKKLMAVAPPGRKMSYELSQSLGNKAVKQLDVRQLQSCLLPASVEDLAGKTVTRPVEYNPPSE
jgi:uncharacterized LabA/DUF88 family protein